MRQRKQLIVNWSVQGPILIRLAVHMITFAGATAVMLMIFWMVQNHFVGPEASSQLVNSFWYRALPFAAAAITVFPFMLWDMVRITHRLAGPLYRFEQVLQKFEDTGVLEQTQLRENDLLIDFRNQFNRFVTVIHERFPEAAGTSETLKCFSEEPVESNGEACV